MYENKFFTWKFNIDDYSLIYGNLNSRISSINITESKIINLKTIKGSITNAPNLDDVKKSFKGIKIATILVDKKFKLINKLPKGSNLFIKNNELTKDIISYFKYFKINIITKTNNVNNFYTLKLEKEMLNNKIFNIAALEYGSWRHYFQNILFKYNIYYKKPKGTLFKITVK